MSAFGIEIICTRCMTFQVLILLFTIAVANSYLIIVIIIEVGSLLMYTFRVEVSTAVSASGTEVLKTKIDRKHR